MLSSTSTNHFLNCLSADDQYLLQIHLRPVNLPQGAIIFDTAAAIERVIFPHTGAASVVVRLAGGQSVATGLIGRNGVLGASAALGGRTALNQTIVQIRVTGAAIDSGTLTKLADQSASLRTALVLWNRMVLAQAQHIAACNAIHGLQQRLCGWLMRTRDLVESDGLPLTHDFLSQMLGVRRASVTLIAQHLHDLGIISCRRALFTVLDPERLEQSACECYRSINDHFDRLIGWQPRVATSRLARPS
jgi:CRP-like cAMP-binding protein